MILMSTWRCSGFFISDTPHRIAVWAEFSAKFFKKKRNWIPKSHLKTCGQLGCKKHTSKSNFNTSQNFTTQNFTSNQSETMTIVPRLDRGFFEFVLLHPRYTFLCGTECPFGMRIIYALFFGRKRCIPTQKYASVAKLNVANFKNTV